MVCRVPLEQEEKAKNPNGQPKAILGNAAAMAGLKLHIGNLHQNITEDDLGEICRSFGEVSSRRVAPLFLSLRLSPPLSVSVCLSRSIRKANKMVIDGDAVCTVLYLHHKSRVGLWLHQRMIQGTNIPRPTQISRFRSNVHLFLLLAVIGNEWITTIVNGWMNDVEGVWGTVVVII